jgi:hypothetical protein
MQVAEFFAAVALVTMVAGFFAIVRRAGARTIAVVAALAFAGSAWAQASGPSRGVPGRMLSTTPGARGVLGQVPGGTLSVQPGIGGLGVPGQVAGGTLSLQAGVGGLGFPGQVPGGMLGTTPPCGYGPCNLAVPWLATGTPGAFSAPNAYNAGATPQAGLPSP